MICYKFDNLWWQGSTRSWGDLRSHGNMHVTASTLWPPWEVAGYFYRLIFRFFKLAPSELKHHSKLCLCCACDRCVFFLQTAMAKPSKSKAPTQVRKALVRVTVRCSLFFSVAPGLFNHSGFLRTPCFHYLFTNVSACNASLRLQGSSFTCTLSKLPCWWEKLTRPASLTSSSVYRSMTGIRQI